MANALCVLVDHNVLMIFWYRVSVNKARQKGKQQEFVTWWAMEKRGTAHEVLIPRIEHCLA